MRLYKGGNITLLNCWLSASVLVDTVIPGAGAPISRALIVYFLARMDLSGKETGVTCSPIARSMLASSTVRPASH